MPSQRLVEVLIETQPTAAGATGRHGELRVLLEDVSVADARAEIVARTTVSDADITPNRPLRAVIEVPAGAIDPRRSYNIRVHFSAQPGDAIRLGDLVSTEAAPVLTMGHSAQVVVRLQEVK